MTRWIDTLEQICTKCLKPSIHMAFFESRIFDPITSKSSLYFESYHFCPNCKVYAKEKTNHNNYLLLYQNNISLRTDSKGNNLNIPLDPSY